MSLLYASAALTWLHGGIKENKEIYVKEKQSFVWPDHILITSVNTGSNACEVNLCDYIIKYSDHRPLDPKDVI